MSDDIKPGQSIKAVRFITSENGTILDTQTGLMWAVKDNGKHINWYDAERYCENYRGGGYNDWRMPTPYELHGLWEGGIRIDEGVITITGHCVWGAERKGSRADGFHFGSGYTDWNYTSYDGSLRALPVRGKSQKQKYEQSNVNVGNWVRLLHEEKEKAFEKMRRQDAKSDLF